MVNSQILQRILVKWSLKLPAQVDGENVIGEFCQRCFSGTALFNLVAISHMHKLDRVDMKILSL